MSAKQPETKHEVTKTTPSRRIIRVIAPSSAYAHDSPHHPCQVHRPAFCDSGNGTCGNELTEGVAENSRTALAVGSPSTKSKRYLERSERLSRVSPADRFAAKARA
jgi:hypothetical protein